MDVERFTIAAAQDRVADLRKGIKGGIDVNARGSQNAWTALHWAVSKDARSAVQFLLDHGADPNIKGKLGDTALLLAVLRQPKPELVQLLLRAGADPTIENNIGVSPQEAAASIAGLPDDLLQPGGAE